MMKFIAKYLTLFLLFAVSSQNNLYAKNISLEYSLNLSTQKLGKHVGYINTVNQTAEINHFFDWYAYKETIQSTIVDALEDVMEDEDETETSAIIPHNADKLYINPYAYVRLSKVDLYRYIPIGNGLQAFICVFRI